MTPTEYRAAPVPQRLTHLVSTPEGRGQHKLAEALAGQQNVSLSGALAVLAIRSTKAN